LVSPLMNYPSISALIRAFDVGCQLAQQKLK